MVECFKCGISEEKVRLFDAITGEGIVKICKECSIEENVPLVKKTFEPDEPLPQKSVYERLSNMSGLNAEEHKRKISNGDVRETGLKQQETSLRELVDSRFEQKAGEKQEKKDDLVENFHWIVMRARRSKKMNREQLAREIAQPLQIVKDLEMGILPEDYLNLVNKVENCLKIRITKSPYSTPESASRESMRQSLGFDSATAKNITVSDLHKMKEEKGDYEGVFEGQKEDLSMDDSDLNMEEIDGGEVSLEEDDSMRR